jgi:hypothetical protein
MFEADEMVVVVGECVSHLGHPVTDTKRSRVRARVPVHCPGMASSRTTKAPQLQASNKPGPNAAFVDKVYLFSLETPYQFYLIYGFAEQADGNSVVKYGRCQR